MPILKIINHIKEMKTSTPKMYEPVRDFIMKIIIRARIVRIVRMMDFSTFRSMLSPSI